MFRRHKTAAVGAVFCALFLLILVGAHVVAVWQVYARRQQAAVEGEKFEIRDLAPVYAPSAETVRFISLAGRLQVSRAHLYPRLMAEVQPGVARMAWRQTALQTGKSSTNIWPALRRSFAQDQTQLATLQQLIFSGKVVIVDQVNMKDPFATLLPYLANLKRVSDDFSTEAVLDLHDGRISNAFDEALTTARTLRIPAGMFLISQTVRYANISRALRCVWELLQTNAWTDDQLRELQSEWAGINFFDDTVPPLKMEEAVWLTEIDAARRSRGNVFGQGANPLPDVTILMDFRKAGRALYDAFPRYWAWKWVLSYRQQRDSIGIAHEALCALRETQAGRYTVLKLPTPASDTDMLDFNYFDLDFEITKNYASFIRRTDGAQTQVGMVVTVLALQRYFLAHHAYPRTLSELCPQFLAAVPLDYFDCHPLRYRLNSDGTYTLYSVGEDGVDNGGDPTPAGKRDPSFESGRDWVWPRAAQR